MTLNSLFAYSWHIDDDQLDVTIMRIYGTNEEDENICVRINNFTPYAYLELPDHVTWTIDKVRSLSKKIDSIVGEARPLKKTLIFKKKLYYANIGDDGEKKLFPYLFCSFSSKRDIKTLMYKLKRRIKINGVGNFTIKMHEESATPILQLTTMRDIPTAGWINFTGKLITGDDKATRCDREYIVKWKNLFPSDNTKMIFPKALHFDLEVFSSNPLAMPDATIHADKIFQSSMVLTNSKGEMEKHLLTLGDPDQKTVGEDVIIHKFPSEYHLIVGFQQFILEHSPSVITGYNIFSFDIPYLIKRAKMLYCISEFDRMGMFKGHAAERIIKWSSSAFKNQEFEYLDAEGRLFIDLLPIIRRDYKLSKYNLKTVSTKFIGQSKEELSPKGIFKCCQIGTTKNKKGEYGLKARKAMGICGSYCIQDSVLVAKLYEKLQIWIGLCVMASTCNVPIFCIYTKGQQIKVFSQVYKFCLHDNTVVESNGYEAKEDEWYQGAKVLQPVPGVYDKVVPFDFASLYPTTMIAYNIDYSTFVRNDNIPDEDCHVMEWEDHCGCEHDETERKTKPKHIICCSRYFRFYKKIKGVLPTIIQNLLDARRHTRSKIKVMKKMIKNPDDVDDEELDLVNLTCGVFVDKIYDEIPLTEEDKANIDEQIKVLDKRQKALKVAANSMYGAMGVKKGYLPFMPGAMATTAMGRRSIDLLVKTIRRKYKGDVIYGDTDSNYAIFHGLETAEEIWDHSIRVAAEITKLFPKPIELEFEEVIYWRFFILSKKRYMSLSCYRNGVLNDEIEKKGVLLARRDNCQFVRWIYEKVVMMVFHGSNRQEVVEFVLENLNRLCSSSIPFDQFTMTKSVGDVGGMMPVPFVDEDGKKKVHLGQYKAKILSADKMEREEQFYKKGVDNSADYYEQSLPAVVQLAERMKRRGQIVSAGSRLEYVITVAGGPKAKQSEKVEDAQYCKQFGSVVKLDYLDYLRLLANPLDQVINTAFKKGPRDIVGFQYKYRCNVRQKAMDRIASFSRPNITLI
jgi:DNA polymerase elongation subunit (family B)